MTSIVLEDDVGFYTGVKSSSDSFLYIMYSIPVPEDRGGGKKVMSSKFPRKRSYIYIVFLEEGRVRGAEFWSFFPLSFFFHFHIRIIGWTCKAS